MFVDCVDSRDSVDCVDGRHSMDCVDSQDKLAKIAPVTTTQPHNSHKELGMWEAMTRDSA